MNVKELVSKMTLKEKASLLSGSDFWHTRAVKRLGIPEFMMCDGPNGLRKQIGQPDHLGVNASISTVCYPSAVSVAASFDVDLARQLGEALGDECLREDVSMLLGPGLNMKRSPVCGRNFEYYSEDPYLAGKIAAAYVKGLQSKNVAACPKHFAANNQEYRRMSGNSIVDERTLHEIYLAAFEIMIKEASPKAIMCSYNKLNGTYLSENKYMLTDVLRKKFGFKGFVVTDWGAGKGPKEGVEAGLDLIMPGGTNEHMKAIIKAVESGKLSEKKVDKAVTNILNTFDWTTKADKTKIKKSGAATRKADYALAEKMAEESAILLKNAKHTLPIGKNKKVLFVGEFAKHPRYQGSGSSHINSANVSNAYDAAKGRDVSYVKGYDIKDAAKNEKLLKEAVKAAKSADVAVVFAGLPASYESEGFDRKDINLPPEHDRLIFAVAEAAKRTVVVMHNGAPVAMPWIDKVDAVLGMQLSGDGVGEASVKLLYGEANPSGKLPEAYPKKLSDNPSFLNFPGEAGNPVYAEGIFIGYRYYEKKRMQVLFPFGHGLSYTEFEYSDVTVSKEKITGKDKLKVSVTVWNVGKYAGKEAVQLYVSANDPKVIRPTKELKGFTKVYLEPGEKKTVTFELDERAFAYYETKIHDFYAPTGDYTIMVGASSLDIRETAQVHLENSKTLPCNYDLFTPVEDILETKEGKKALKPLFDKMFEGGGADATMGEGGDEMMVKMMMEMPIHTLSSFGIMTLNQIEKILKKING
ncbi:MAG: glycoside hydrolase family 3 C-terminal domain-containing protein [Butyrivibrio sp.]|nr:glycoside hydrolase family 3 C-terminal domain-containing protein [Butyrivibrio sp.]